MTLWWHILDMFNSRFEPLQLCFPKFTERLTTVHCPPWKVALGVMLPEVGDDSNLLWCAMLSWFFMLLLVVSKVRKCGQVKQDWRDWRKWTKYGQHMTTGINITMMFVKMFVRCQKGHPACAKVSWKAPSNCETYLYFYLYTAFVEICFLMTSYSFCL